MPVKLPVSTNVNASKINEISGNFRHTLSIEASITKPFTEIKQNQEQFSSNGQGYETSIPEIREQMSKFYSIFNQLKRDINEQGFSNESFLPISS